MIYNDKREPLGEVTDMEILDNVLVMKHMSDSYYFSFIDIVEGKLIKRWGSKGRGPGEYIQLGSGFSLSDRKLVFLDCARKEINKISIKEIIEDSDLVVSRTVYPNTANFRPRDMNIINNKSIVIGSFTTGRFGLLDSDNNIVECHSEYPFNYEHINGLLMGSVFQSKMKSNSKNCKFVIQTFCSDIFEVYKVTDDSILNIFTSPFQFKPVLKEHNRKNTFSVDSYKSIAGLMSMAVSDDLICFTYSSQSYSDARSYNFASDEILCFDWDGHKVRKYHLPFPINKFCINNKYIYGVSYQSNETRIYKFKM